MTALGDDFESSTLQWHSAGDNARLSHRMYHGGKQSLELLPGAYATKIFPVLPGHRYKLSVWLKTASGSDEIQVSTKNLAGDNVSAASALADWSTITREFSVPPGTKTVSIELYHPGNAGGNPAWADDVSISDMGPDAVAVQAGIKPLPPRIPASQYGLAQQPNEKLKWLLDARFGMFIHWGLYAGPARGEWYMENAGVPIETYRKLAYPSAGDEYFDADKFDADAWAALAKRAGMRYMCLTTMHHDGYALFDSRYMNSFTSKQTLNRDFVKEYTDACRKAGLKVGLYKTLINWRYPGYFDVSGTGARKNRWNYTTDSAHKENARLLKEGLYADTKSLMTNYGKIDMIFWDGGWLGQQGTDADAAYFWEPGKFLSPANPWPVNPYFQEMDPGTGKPLGLMGLVRKYQPDIIVNPRSSWMGDFESEEGGAPITGPVRTKEIWQKCMTMGGAWGYTSAMEDTAALISLAGIKRMIADVTIRNMSLLLNVGPDRHGTISKAVTHVLEETGAWLGARTEAIYGTYGGPWNPRDGQFGFAYRDSTIYVFLLDDFKDLTFTLPAVNRGQKAIKVYEVGRASAVSFSQNHRGEIRLHFPAANDNIRIFAVVLNRKVMDYP
jgi:alpha-L-fucosidase